MRLESGQQGQVRGELGCYSKELGLCSAGKEKSLQGFVFGVSQIQLVVRSKTALGEVRLETSKATKRLWQFSKREKVRV